MMSLSSPQYRHISCFFGGGGYDAMICGHVCVFLRMMSFCLCENQISLVLTYNAPCHVMTDLFASSRFIYGFTGVGGL